MRRGADVPAGEAGTLWIKGGSAAVLYWQAREKSKEVLRGDWVVTGDHMRRDGEGLFWYEGRTDDMLKVGGIFVSPYEVENCLLQHPRVAECAVIGYKDPDGLVKPKAYVVPHGGGGDEVLARELQDFVKTRLAAFKYPRARGVRARHCPRTTVARSTGAGSGAPTPRPEVTRDRREESPRSPNRRGQCSEGNLPAGAVLARDETDLKGALRRA